MKPQLTWPILFALLITSCTYVVEVPPTLISTTAVVLSSAVPTTNLTLPATPAPTLTTVPTAIPTLQVGNLNLPNAFFAEPDLFSLSQPTAPIYQFVNAMNQAGIDITPEQVAQGLTFSVKEANESLLPDHEMNPIVIATYQLDPDPFREGETLEGDIPLFFAAYDSETETYSWHKLTPAFLADNLGLKFWTQTLSWKLDDPIYSQMILDNANGLVCAGDFEWDDLFGEERSDLIREMIAQIKNGEEPDISRLNFAGIDRLVAFAADHDMQIMVLHLFDPFDIPPDVAQEIVSGAIPYEDFERFMEWYVKMIMTRYPLAEWSVFNEMAAYSLWGDEIYKPYIQFLLAKGLHYQMFTWAHDAAPNAILILNENFRRPGQSDETMARLTNTYLDLLKDLLQNGAPVTKAGIEGHVSIYASSTPEEISSLLDIVLATGVPIFGFTEVTVGISENERALQSESIIRPANENIYFAQTRFYQSMLQATLAKRGNWATFGFSDAYSMFNDLGTPEVAALPLDEDYRPKAAYYGLIQVLYNQFIFEQNVQTTRLDGALIPPGFAPYAHTMIMSSDILLSMRTYNSLYERCAVMIYTEPTLNGFADCMEKAEGEGKYNSNDL
ncbi:MAG TPA: endo-1,4-beta-xylanase [Anaerolineaceae bacterium]|nr:endo-1,4-beta-xylanase [Anaerolineaceae bacterium]